MDNENNDSLKVRMRVAAIVESGNGTSYNLILQEVGGERRLVMGIGLAEAQAVAVMIERVRLPRPLTHDVLAQMVMASDTVVDEVVVEDLRDGYYIASIICHHLGQLQIFDARTSDAVALALRCGSPIYVKERVFGLAMGAPTGRFVVRKAAQRSQSLEEMSRADLEALMQKAIDVEDYEKAQEIQSILKRK